MSAIGRLSGQGCCSADGGTAFAPIVPIGATRTYSGRAYL